MTLVSWANSVNMTLAAQIEASSGLSPSMSRTYAGWDDIPTRTRRWIRVAYDAALDELSKNTLENADPMSEEERAAMSTKRKEPANGHDPEEEP